MIKSSDSGKSKIVQLFFGVVVPFLVFVPLALILKYAAAIAIPEDQYDESVGSIMIGTVGPIAAYAISAGVGFVFFRRAFSGHHVLIGLVYFPVIMFLMLYSALYLAGYLFGQAP